VFIKVKVKNFREKKNSLIPDNQRLKKKEKKRLATENKKVREENKKVREEKRNSTGEDNKEYSGR